jgi:hypothetical protein
MVPRMRRNKRPRRRSREARLTGNSLVSNFLNKVGSHTMWCTSRLAFFLRQILNAIIALILGRREYDLQERSRALALLVNAEELTCA